MERRREFRVAPLASNSIPYDPLVDHHLEYYFASKNTRHVLVKTKVVNRRNQILDRNLAKMIQHGQLDIHNKFRLKKSKPKRYDSRNDKSLQNGLSSTLGKKEFEEFLETCRRQIKTKTPMLRLSQTETLNDVQDHKDKKEEKTNEEDEKEQPKEQTQKQKGEEKGEETREQSKDEAQTKVVERDI